MINSIIQQLTGKITAMPWVERYGGLVRPAVKSYIDENNGLVFNKTYPVSCDVNEKECWEKGRYLDLVPNDRYKSITYFEQRGTVSVKPSSYKGRDALEFNAPMSFVAWLNLPKLGIADCSSPIFEASALKMFLSEFDLTGLEFPIAGFKIIIEGIAPRNEAIFTKYSYGDKFGLLLYPFDFFSIHLTIRWFVQPHCLPEYTSSDAIC